MAMDELKYKDGKFTVNGIDVSNISATTEAVEIAQTVSANTQQFSFFDDPEGRYEIVSDADNKIVSYRDVEGLHENCGINTTKLSSDYYNLSDDNALQIKEALNKIGFTVKQVVDWSEEKIIHIPIPKFAMINIKSSIPRNQITAKSGMGVAGVNCDVPVTLQFWDMNGNYFSKPVLISAQGDSSMLMKIKNNAIDLNDGSKIKFGNWVEQDSFHFKKYFIDAFRGQAIVGYNLMEKIYNQHPIGQQKPFSYTFENITTDMSGSTDFNLDFNNAALCHPDGFPIVEYWNGEYGGLYVFALKKHRDNYKMDKKNPQNILLDGTIDNDTVFGGTVNWSSFEIKNPKGLLSAVNPTIVSGEHAYEPFTPTQEEIGTIGDNHQEINGEKPSDWNNDDIVKKYGNNPPLYIYRTDKNKWYRLIEVSGYIFNKYDGDHPTEIVGEDTIGYDPTNPAHILNNSVKQHILRLSHVQEDLVASKTKETFEKYFNVPFFIDYFLQMQICAHNNWGKNWIWVCYDGDIWCPTIYDNDSIFGQLSDGTTCWLPNVLIHSKKSSSGFSATHYLYDIYTEEIENVYSSLRKEKVFDSQEIAKMLNEWVSRIGYENLKEEHDYCRKQGAPIPSYRGYGTPENWKLGGTGDGELYSDTKSYNVGDVVIIKTPNYDDRKYTCQIDGTVGVYPTEYDSYPNFGGFYTSIYRVRKWLNSRLGILDNLLHYNN